MAYIGNNPKLKSIVSTGDTLANLTAEPRREGRLVYATDTKVFYRDDGTSLLPVNTTAAAVNPSFTGFLVSATDPLADFATITLAIAGAAAGDKIMLLDETYTETVSITKQLHIFGMGSKSNIVGAITFAAGSSNSTMKDVRTTLDINIAVAVTGIQILNTYLATTKTIIDAGSGNVWIAIGE